MNKRMLSALFLLVTLAVADHPVYSQTGQKCAFIAEASGRAVVRRGGKFFLLTGMEGAWCGDVVKVMPGAKVAVADCGNNLKAEIRGPAEFSLAPKKLVFKTGKAENNVAIDAELCPFFQDQAFAGPTLAQVDPDGRNPEKYATFVIKEVPEMTMAPEFSGYISEIKGQVFYSRPNVLQITGDVVPRDGVQVLSRRESGYSIYSCAEGKKYRVEGPALIQFTPGKPDRGPVTFLAGQAMKVDEFDRAKCEASAKAILEARTNNLVPVGLDGK